MKTKPLHHLNLFKWCSRGLLASLILTISCVSPVEKELDSLTKQGQSEAVSNTPRASHAKYHGANSDVLLQGFHWNSHNSGTWNTINNKANDIQSAGFTMVWMPPISKSTGGAGYLPNEWYNLNSAHGSESELRAAVNSLNNKGIQPIADIVINHRVGTNDWADFSNPSFSNNAEAVTQDDEWAPSSGNWDTGDGYAAGRDLDHTNGSVQTEIKNWLTWLRNDVGFKGFRYDYVKGFSASYVGEYNDHANPTFSVGELWADITGDYFASGNDVNYHRQAIINWIDGTGDKSTAFDFTTKWQLMLAVERNEYWRLGDSQGKAIGTIGWWPQRSVTFIDNHDTGPSPGGGQDHWPFPANKVEQGYAYILTHPGIPTVYWPHYFDWGNSLQNKIKSLIALRKSQGIGASSTVSIQVADQSKYAAIINDNTAVKIGYGNWNPGSGWVLAESGNDWAVWKKHTTSSGFQGPGTYILKAGHSEKALYADNGANGTNVKQGSYQDNALFKWVISSTEGGYYKVIHKASNRALDVAGISTANGANIHLWSYVGGNNQQWSIENTGSGYWRVVAKHSDKSIDVAQASTAENANVHQWTSFQVSNQRWRFTKLD